MPAASRIGDDTFSPGDDGIGTVIAGSPTVYIGDGPYPSFAVIAPGVLSIGGAPVYENTAEGQAAVVAADATYMGPTNKTDAPDTPAPNTAEYIECSKFPAKITTNEMQIQVSKYFKLAHAQQIPVDQRGLTANKIACNWSALCLEILDPIIAAGFPILASGKLNSGFRTVAGGMGNTDHGLGCAADISAGSTSKTIEMFKWIINSGLPFSQCIYEKHNSAWVHVSFNGKTQAMPTRIMVTLTGSAPYSHSTGPNGAGLPALAYSLQDNRYIWFSLTTIVI